MTDEHLPDENVSDSQKRPDPSVDAADTETDSKPAKEKERDPRPPEAAGGESPPDPFDPARLRLSQDYAKNLGVKKALLTVPVRKPSKEWWLQTHPDESYRIQTAVLELKEDREVYLVDPTLWQELGTESTFSPRALFTAITRQGVVFLWPVRLPGLDGRIDEWSRSERVLRCIRR